MVLRDVWSAVRREMGLSPAGREVTVRPTDVFIVSYPRSGNTWLRFLLANVMWPAETTDFLSIEDRIPDIYASSDKQMRRLPDPRILKSHESFDSRYPTVVYVVRDPREVVTSYYRWHLKVRVIPDGYPPATYVDRFIRGSLDGYGSWSENVGSWMGAREGEANFQLVRYEALRSSPVETLRPLCDLLGVSRSPEALERAVERSSVSRLSELERLQGAKWKPIQGSRSDISFIGTESSLQKVPHFSGELLEKIEGAFASRMKSLGYL